MLIPFQAISASVNKVAFQPKTLRSTQTISPALKKEIRGKLEEKSNAFKSNDNEKTKLAEIEHEKTIKKCKTDYKKKVQKQFEEGKSYEVWQGLAKMTDYKKKSSFSDPDPSLPNQLNEFYSRFDLKNTNPPPPSPPAEVTSADPPFSIPEAEVISQLKKLNARKAAGPDAVSPATLKNCAQQLGPVYTDIFNTSIERCEVPVIFKTSTIVPVPKKPKISSLNDFRPVALTPIAMKVLERFVLKYIKSVVEPLMDPHQFAYRANRSVEDAVALALHYVLKHLESPKCYARILFIDYSSAFNTIIPAKLALKLNDFGIDPHINFWISDFLKSRPQRVKIDTMISDIKILSTGAPQGCVLSPLLFTMFTNDCRSVDNSVLIFKFSDDTTIEGLISDADETGYRTEVDRLVLWCNNNDLELNVGKTKEMIVDFRAQKTHIQPLTINGQEVEIVDKFKFLGTTISQDLKWEENARSAAKKANQRLHFLRQLKKFRASSKILMLFYRATIESVLAFSLSVWFGNATRDDKKMLESVIKNASKIVGTVPPSLDEIYQSRVQKRAEKIIKDCSHPAHQFFERMPSGRRFRSMITKTHRFRNSFVPSAIRILSNNGAPEHRR